MDHIPELLGEIERLAAVLWAPLTIRSIRPQSTENRVLGIEEVAFSPRYVVRTGRSGRLPLRASRD